MAADRHGVAAAASKYLSQALFRVEGFAALIEDYLGDLVPSRTSPISGISAPVSRLSNVV
jgi:hypothetical protein